MLVKLRFPLFNFAIGVLVDYDIAPSQLIPNYWRILAAFYIRCKRFQVDDTSQIFRLFYNLKRSEG